MADCSMSRKLYPAHLRNSLDTSALEADSGGLINVARAVQRSAEASHDSFRTFSVENDSRILEGELGGSDGELGKASEMLNPSGIHELRWVKVADLSGHLAGVGRRVEGCDPVNGGLAGDEVLPKGVLADPVGGHHAQAGHHYPAPLHRADLHRLIVQMDRKNPYLP
jgi:hypothetical protein